MTDSSKNGGLRPGDIGGAPFPEAPDDARVAWWDHWADLSYGRVVFYLDKARRCYLDANLKPFGISSAHIPILTYLWEGHDGDTQSVIAEVVGVDPATVTRVSQRLQELGYIDRSVSDRDSRALCLSLTESGWALADHVKSIDSAWTEQITGYLSPDDRQETLRELQRITARAQGLCESTKSQTAGTESA